ncbi:sigma-70 family RNA polymerase sigma factor [Mangrovihabitans endophyticus]|uniref:RNA polymerase sigma factor n=1 Tax=Mangrovihabitans endophyticus TaxID=1751298 RepID=A0A8J3C572_9ACTN|nr:sigma-70 family RNA polymerase sigma factor [Mangrovihabitans endophyticus]GGL20607.1 RNA polymerase sigma factor [Mangrovihabitans endophyticus]
MPDDDLTALAYAAARGDRDAVTDLIRRTQRDVLRFLAPLTSPADVEDLAQETYLRAVRALPSFAGRSSVRTWLLAIARRVAADHVRLATRRPRIAGLPDWQATAEAAAPHAQPRFDEQHALTALLTDLAPERREAFVITQVAGLSYADAAEVCGCPIGTIRSRVARAREDLIAALHDPDAEGRATA